MSDNLEDMYIQDWIGQSRGGFNPSQDEYVRRIREMRSNDDFRNRIMMEDPRAQYAAAMYQSTMGENPSDAAMNRHRMMMGMLANSRMGSALMGGSRLDMYQGIHMGLANAGSYGLRMNNGPLQFTHGGGAVTTPYAEAMLKTLEQRYFTPTGGSIGHLTHGLNRNDFGGLMATMGRRGSFAAAGITGEVTTGAAGFDVTLDKLNKEKLTKLTDAGAEAVGKIKDILGDIGSNKLIKALEDLNGTPIVTGEQYKQASRKLDEVKAMALAGGTSPEAVLAIHRQASMTLEMQGMGSSGAAAGAMTAVRAMMSKRVSDQNYAGARAGQGVYVRDMSSQVMQRHLDDQTLLSRESPEVAAMLLDIERSGMSAEDKAEMRKQLIARVGGAKNSSEMALAIGEMEREVIGAGGRGINAMMSLSGGDPEAFLGGESGAALASASKAQADARLVNEQLPMKLASLLGDDMTKDELKRGTDLFRTKSRRSINDIVENNPNDRVAKALLDIMDMDSDFQTYISEEDQLALDKERYAQLLGGAAFDTNRTQPNFVEGLLGGGSISRAQAFEYMNLNNKEKLRKEEGWSKLKTDAERGKYLLDLEKQGRVVNLDSDGNLYSADQTDVDEAKKKAEEARQNRAYEVFGVMRDDYRGAGREGDLMKALSEGVEGKVKDFNIKTGDLEDLDKLIDAAGGDDMIREQLRDELQDKINNTKFKNNEKDKERKQELQERLDKLYQSPNMDLQFIGSSVISLLQQILQKV